MSYDPPASDLPALSFDFEEYRKFVEDEALTEAQARELLGAIWLIVISFVDLGFHFDPVQQAMDVNKNHAPLAADSAPMVSSRHAFKQTNISKAAVCRKARAVGRKDS